MAITVTARGSGTHNVGSTTLVITPGSDFAAGSTGVLEACFDNSEASGNSPLVDVTDSQGNSWTVVVNQTRSPGAASNDGTTALFAISDFNVAPLTTSDTITVNFSASTVAKCWVLSEALSNTGFHFIVSDGNYAEGAGTSLTVTSTWVEPGVVVFGFSANEYGTAQTLTTPDADSTNGTWSSNVYVEIGTTTAGQNLTTQYKVTTGGGTQTYNLTMGTSADYVIWYIVMAEDVTRLYVVSTVDGAAYYFHDGNQMTSLTGSTNWWRQRYELKPNGSSSGTGPYNVTSVAGPTNGVELGLDGSWIEVAVSMPLAAAVTISHDIMFNVWASEGNALANAAVNAIVYRVSGAGVWTQVLKTARVTEAAASAAVNVWTATPSSTAFAAGDRIAVVFFFDDAGTMAAGYSLQVYTDGTIGTSGDTWVRFGEQLAFDSGPAYGEAMRAILSDAAAEVGPNGAHYDAKALAYVDFYTHNVDFGALGTIAAPTVSVNHVNGGGDSSISVSKPSGTAAGDLLICAVFQQNTYWGANYLGPLVTEDGAWTMLYYVTAGTDSAGVTIWSKRAKAYEPASYRWNDYGPNSTFRGATCAVMVRLTGVDVAQPDDSGGVPKVGFYDAYKAVSSGTSIAPLTISGDGTLFAGDTDPNLVLLTFLGYPVANGTITTGLAGMTTVNQDTSGTMASLVQTKLYASPPTAQPGVAPSWTWVNSGKAAAFGMLLRPSRGAASVTAISPVLGPVSPELLQSDYRSLILGDGAFYFYRLADTVSTTADEAGRQNLTFAGSPTKGVTGALTGDPNKAVTLNSANSDYLYSAAAPFPLGTNDVTIEFWAKWTSRSVFFFMENVNQSQNVGVSVRWDGDQIVLQMDGWTNPWTCEATTSGTAGRFADGVYHHVVCSLDRSGNGQIFVDGVAAGPTTDFSVLASDSLPAAEAFYIGRRGDAGTPYYMTGTVDELAYYHLALDLAAAANHYAVGNARYLEWFSFGLIPVTFTGAVRAALYRTSRPVMGEIAICDSDGTNPVVWGRNVASVKSGVGQLQTPMSNMLIAGPSTAISKGQRLRFRMYFDDTQDALSAGASTFFYGGYIPAGQYVADHVGASYLSLSTELAEYVPFIGAVTLERYGMVKA